jgi:hypothetical protein
MDVFSEEHFTDRAEEYAVSVYNSITNLVSKESELA